MRKGARDMLDAYRIQAQAGPVTDKALEEILFRAAHGVVESLALYPAGLPPPARVAWVRDQPERAVSCGGGVAQTTRSGQWSVSMRNGGRHE
jgi:hypothetical protein